MITKPSSTNCGACHRNVTRDHSRGWINDVPYCANRRRWWHRRRPSCWEHQAFVVQHHVDLEGK